MKPSGYPIPVDGPVGELLRKQGRHNMRPAHLHFLIYKTGLKTHISQVYLPDDPNIETDVQFGVTKHLIGDYVRHEDGKAPAKSVTVTAGEQSLPMCSYPEYPGYVSGPPSVAASFRCMAR